MNLKKYTDKELLSIYAEIMNVLRERGILRSSNNPVADYAEFLTAKKFDLELQPNSNKSFDAIDKQNKIKYQIKARRITKFSSSKQLGVIRNLKTADFNFLIAVIFDEDFNVKEMYKMPKGIIANYARFSKHQNGYILIMNGAILKDNKLKKIV